MEKQIVIIETPKGYQIESLSYRLRPTNMSDQLALLFCAIGNMIDTKFTVVTALPEFKAKRLDNGEWITGFYTKIQKGAAFVPVIEVIKEWDEGDYIESYEVDGETLTNVI